MARSGPGGQPRVPTPGGPAVSRTTDGMRQALERNATVRFFIESFDELAKVHWPSRKETINLTILVIVASLVVGAFLGGVDFFFAWIVQHIIGAA